MRGNRNKLWVGCLLGLGLALLAPARSQAGTAAGASCMKVVLDGEVSAGQEWKAAFGQGWVFRLTPILPGTAGYSGWDLVVDREPAAGYPDALLLATPPYNSINEREVGTTFGLRAQDVIGWNPRSFRFLTEPAAFRESQRLFQVMEGSKHVSEAPVANSREGKAMEHLLKINQRSTAGQFRILDAHLSPGISDAAPYAERWAIQSVKTQHTFTQSGAGKPTPLGKLDWIRFSVTLWLPGEWKAPKEVHGTRAACSE